MSQRLGFTEIGSHRFWSHRVSFPQIWILRTLILLVPGLVRFLTGNEFTDGRISHGFRSQRLSAHMYLDFQ